MYGKEFLRHAADSSTKFDALERIVQPYYFPYEIRAAGMGFSFRRAPSRGERDIWLDEIDWGAYLENLLSFPKYGAQANISHSMEPASESPSH